MSEASPDCPARPGVTSWQMLLLKLSALFSGVGAPLFFFDQLTPTLGWLRLVPMLPGLLAMWGVLSTWDRPSKFERAGATVGFVGALALLLMSLTAVGMLVRGADTPNPGLVSLGLVVGVVFSIVAMISTAKFLARSAPPKPAPSPELPAAIARKREDRA
jgi:hypothetical protein